jgi:hypothetical protein
MEVTEPKKRKDIPSVLAIPEKSTLLLESNHDILEMIRRRAITARSDTTNTEQMLADYLYGDYQSETIRGDPSKQMGDHLKAKLPTWNALEEKLKPEKNLFESSKIDDLQKELEYASTNVSNDRNDYYHLIFSSDATPESKITGLQNHNKLVEKHQKWMATVRSVYLQSQQNLLSSGKYSPDQIEAIEFVIRLMQQTFPTSIYEDETSWLRQCFIHPEGKLQQLKPPFVLPAPDSIWLRISDNHYYHPTILLNSSFRTSPDDIEDRVRERVPENIEGGMKTILTNDQADLYCHLLNERNATLRLRSHDFFKACDLPEQWIRTNSVIIPLQDTIAFQQCADINDYFTTHTFHTFVNLSEMDKILFPILTFDQHNYLVCVLYPKTKMIRYAFTGTTTTADEREKKHEFPQLAILPMLYYNKCVATPLHINDIGFEPLSLPTRGPLATGDHLSLSMVCMLWYLDVLMDDIDEVNFLKIEKQFVTNYLPGYYLRILQSVEDLIIYH